MLRHLRSAAAGASGHAPAPSPPAPTEGDDEEDSARAIAVSDQRTIYLVNMFIANTVEFLNSFSALCSDKLALLHRKIVKLDSSLTLLEAKLHSIDDTDVLGHCTSQTAHQSSTHEERVNPANLLGESSSAIDACYVVGCLKVDWNGEGSRGRWPRFTWFLATRTICHDSKKMRREKGDGRILHSCLCSVDGSAAPYRSGDS